MDLTPKDTILRDKYNPQVMKRIRLLEDENVVSKKVYGFNFGRDNADNPKIGTSRIAEIGLEIEKNKFDSFSVIEYTLKDGRKMAGITALGFTGGEEKFRNLMREIIGNKANVGNCVFSVGTFNETDKAEAYTIFFDLD